MNLRILLTATLLTGWQLTIAQTSSTTQQSASENTPAAQAPTASGWHRLGDEANGVLGTVTSVAADRFSVKTEKGVRATVYFSANTRFLKQVMPPGAGQPKDCTADLKIARLPGTLEPWRADGIVRGAVIAASGRVTEAQRNVGAVVIVLLDPACAKQARKLLADYGSSWLAGRVIAVDGDRVTLASAIDQGTRVVVLRSDTVVMQAGTGTKADAVHVGEMLRVEGKRRHGAFEAKTVHVLVLPRPRGGPKLPPGNAPRQ
ncbi:MAG: hypothetical protein WCA37_14150 [Terracidiphilus sp.]